jgi:FkbM family methyltransferase
MPRARLLNIPGYNQIAEGRNCHYLYNQNDYYIGKAIERYGEFSRLEMDVLGQLCGPGDFVIEVGANMGAHTVPLAMRVGPQGRVLAFEPQRLVFQNLCANVALNSLQNVDCYWAALGSKDGVLTVPEPDPTQVNNFGGVTLIGIQQGRQIDCHMLDRYLSLPRLQLIKIDVEGMEADVLSGGKELIGKFKPRLYLENDRMEKSEELMRLVDSLGYRMYWHLPPLFNPENFYGVTDNVYGDTVSINMLCVHRDKPMQLNGFPEITDFKFHPLQP